MKKKKEVVISNKKQLAKMLSEVFGVKVTPVILEDARMRMELIFGGGASISKNETPIIVPAPHMVREVKGNKHYFRFTEEEVELLIDYVENTSHSYAEIAKLMGRSVNSIQSKTYQLRLEGRISYRIERIYPVSESDKKKIYTEKELKVILDPLLSAKEAAQKTGRSVSSVKGKRYQMRRKQQE